LVARKLAGGQSINDIATAHAISLNTARTHLKNILSKTSTTRQAELVALVLRSAAATAA
jgi:DNA-binding CsgD family transcriptional regulator